MKEQSVNNGSIRLSKMVNIGTMIERHLMNIGVKDSLDLEAIGSVKAAILFKKKYPDKELNPMVLEGAIRKMYWRRLEDDVVEGVFDDYITGLREEALL